MAIKCGNHRHETVSQVRECQLGGKSVQPFSPQEWSPSGQYAHEVTPQRSSGSVVLDRLRTQHARNDAARPVSAPPATTGRALRGYPASDRQLKFIDDMLQEKDITEVERETAQKLRDADDFTGRQASSMIEWLMKKPRKASGQPETVKAQAGQTSPAVEAGHYAVEVDGTLKFYVVDRPTDGRWAGFTFLSVQASDEKHPIKHRQTKAAILALIAADPKEAMLRYGREIGRCGHCNRTLTDETSRGLGIGPVCRAKLSW